MTDEERRQLKPGDRVLVINEGGSKEPCIVAVAPFRDMVEGKMRIGLLGKIHYRPMDAIFAKLPSEADTIARLQAEKAELLAVLKLILVSPELMEGTSNESRKIAEQSIARAEANP